jgi:glycosyl transferase family 25
MSYHSYVINLPNARDRWEKIEARLRGTGLAYTRVVAVYGRELQLPIPEFDEFWHRLLTGRRPIPAEIGCYLSHIKAIDAFLASEATCTHALIFEDDAIFGDDLPAMVDAALQHADAWDVLRLSTVGHDRVVPAMPLLGNRCLGVNLTRCKGAAGYMINRKAAATFRRKLVPMRLAWDIAFDLEYFWGLKALAVTPFPVVPDERAPTQIQNDINSFKLPSTRYLTVFPYRAAVESARVVMRSLLYVRTVAYGRRAAHVTGQMSGQASHTKAGDRSGQEARGEHHAQGE